MDPRALRVHAALLAAAWNLVHENPLTALSVAQVCRQAGVSRQVFYKHFPDLDSVVLAAVMESFDAAVGGGADPLASVVAWIAEHGRLERNLYPSQVAEQLAQHLREVVRPVCELAVPASVNALVSRADLVTLLVGGLVELLRKIASRDPGTHRDDAANLRALLGVIALGAQR